MTPDERADVLAAVAVELVGRVRDDEPAAFHRWLRHAMVDGGFAAPDDDSLAMMTVLACAVPDDRPWTQLTAWVRLREYGDGRPDTPEKIALRRAALDQALSGGRGILHATRDAKSDRANVAQAAGIMRDGEGVA